jgi:hypothetical protein
MKKAALLEMINALPDDADIRLWNGMVGDWMDIGSLVPTDLVKMSYPTFLELCRLERCQAAKDWDIVLTEDDIAELSAAYKKNYKFELNSYVTQEDVDNGRYKKKTVYLIEAKLRGVSTFDRLGDISY